MHVPIASRCNLVIFSARLVLKFLNRLAYPSHDSPTMNPSAHDPERRRYPRVKAKIPVELTCAGKAPMRTSTDEISLCGCYIENMFTMGLGIKLKLVLSLKDEIIRCMGLVTTKYPQVGNGIDFIDITPEDRLRLSKHNRGIRSK